MNITFLIAALISLTLASTSTCQEKTRNFEFNYATTISEMPPGAMAKVWFPVASDNTFQDVEMTQMQVPSVLHINVDRQFDNKIGFFEARVPESGQVKFSIRYRVNRHEASNDKQGLEETTRQRFLAASRMVPTDGKPTELLREKKLVSDPMELGGQLYEIVEQYMAYDKSKPGYGNGDVLWACNSKTGNCTDFHSLFISLARNQGLPARFEIGFPLPDDANEGSVKGYHCWAWFHTQNGWVPVDISEADKHPELKEYYFGRLTANRIAFSTGRDIELFPKSATKALNYFVYPHVEVDGVAVEKSQMKPEFSFADITPKEKTAVK